ncbi:MAG: thioredoxin-disulfide reductase [Lachnospiraceae bacterium]
MYDVIIIGSGPAGLSAAIYAERARLNTLIFEKEPMSGGQIVVTSEVDNYPGLPGVNGFDLAQTFRDHAEKAGATFCEEEVIRVENASDRKKVITNQNTYETKTVVLAMGATHRKLGVPGEEELAGAGVSYCATCDGAFFKNRVAAVVGGGNVALEDALFLARMCKTVYLIHRRDAFRGEAILQEQVKNTENITILYNTQVKEILGDGQVESLKIVTKTADGEETSDLSVNGVFIAVGILPQSTLAEGLCELDEQGYVKAGEDGVTSTPGIFVAGDIRTKSLRQVITSASDGANCITSAEKYLNGSGSC